MLTPLVTVRSVNTATALLIVSGTGCVEGMVQFTVTVSPCAGAVPRVIVTVVPVMATVEGAIPVPFPIVTL